MHQDSQKVKDQLRAFIIQNYLMGSQKNKLTDHASFLEEGIIDSIGVIELTAFVQETYGIKIEVKEIIPENFDTLNNLANYILKKTS